MANAALATLSNLALPDEAFEWRHEKWGLTDSTTFAERGLGGRYEVRLPETPGSFCLPDMDILADFAIEQATLR